MLLDRMHSISRRGPAAAAVIACGAAFALTVGGGSPAALAATAGTLDLSAAGDTYVSSAYPNTNYGTSGVLTAGSAAANRQIAYLKFPVSGIPVGATGVTVQLQLSRTTHHLPSSLSLSAVASTTWSETALTYNTRPALGATLGTVSPTSTTNTVTFPTNVTGNGAYAFAVTAPTTTTTARFNSSTGSTPTPTLKVSYTKPPPAIWIGAAHNTPDTSITAFDSANATIGPLKVHRSFDSTLPATFAKSSGKDDAAHGYASFVSWKPPGGDFVGAANGAYDAAITAWAKSVPTTGVFATSYHEPEDNMTGPQFVALQRHLYTVVKAANPTIQWGPVHMSYWWKNPSAIGKVSPSSQDSWDVGDAYRDFTAVDNYSRTPLSLQTDPQFHSWYDFFLAKSTKPLFITEYGQYVVPPGGTADPNMQAARAAVIKTDATWLATQPRIQMWLYWDGTGSAGDWTLTDTASQTAWKAAALVGRTS